MRILSLGLITFGLVACNGSSKGGGSNPPPPEPPKPIGLTAAQRTCIQQGLQGRTPLNPYDAVTTYKACGAPDDAASFAQAAEELFVIENGGSWSLK